MQPKLDAAWVHNPLAQRILRLLEEGGFEGYFVGGCVRNALLDKPASDIDIATNARPEHVVALATRHGIKPVPTGIEHGTVTLVSGKDTIEVTTFRKDVATDGRRATVAFSETLSEDARRRDFTINALYADRNGQVTDVVDGLADIALRKIRFIDDPNERIQEDYLRILRFFRFYAWYGDPDEGIDADGLAACATHADGIERLSKERVGAEMAKLLAAPDPAPAVASMQQAGNLARVLPGADGRNLAALVALEGAVNCDPDWRRRLAILGLHDWTDALRLSKKDQRHLSALADALTNDSPVQKIAYQDGAELACSVEMIRAASVGAQLAPDLGARIEAASRAVFPITASDLQPEFTGKSLGRELARLEERWIASDFTLSKSELLS